MARTIHFSNRRWLAAALVAATAAIALIAVRGPGDAGAQSTTSVKAVDNKFQPSRITIETGNSVRWTNAGKANHNVKGTGFVSKTLSPGKTYTKRFTRAGSFPYVCTFHAGMKGTVAVRK